MENNGGKTFSSLMKIKVKEIKEQLKTKQKVERIQAELFRQNLIYQMKADSAATSKMEFFQEPSFTSIPIPPTDSR